MHTKYIYLFAVATLLSQPSLAIETNTPPQFPKSSRLAVYLENKPADRPLKFLLSQQDRDWADLNVSDLANQLDRTISAAGTAEFARLLQPISDTKELAARRVIINTLIQNPLLFEQLNRSVQTFSQQHEDLVAHFLYKPAQVNFIVDPTAPDFLASQSSFAQVLFQTFMTGLVIQNMVYEGMNAGHNMGAVRDGGNGLMRRGWLGYNLIGHVGMLGYVTYATGNNALKTVDNLNRADEYVLRTARALTFADNVEQQINASPLANTEIARAFAKYSDLEQRSEDFTKGAVQAKERLASSDTWLNQVSKLWSMDTYDFLKDSNQDLLKLVQAFAILDAYLSVAKLYIEMKEAKLPVTLAEFSIGDNVQFDFEDLGNPLVPNAVTSNFALGGPTKAQHAVITGPHGCGKTTLMRSTAYAFILGQSILVVPARKAIFTPLNSLQTYFNVGDSILEGLSSFISEHKRVADLTRAASGLKRDDRALFLVDEPYAKTIQNIGEPRVTDFMRKMSTTPGLSVVLATHFEEPSVLEVQTQGHVKNFQPELDAALFPTYRIIDGAATWWFHDSARRDQFLEQMIH